MEKKKAKPCGFAFKEMNDYYTSQSSEKVFSLFPPPGFVFSPFFATELLQAELSLCDEHS
jgi:hypothetical protein